MSSYKILILDTYYSAFLRSFYTKHTGLERQPYREQWQMLMDQGFGTADFYSANLKKLGHEAYDIHANNEFMQKAWAREHGISIDEPTPVEQRAIMVLQSVRRIAAKMPLRYLKSLFRPVMQRLDRHQTWVYDILAAQIKHYKPDILLNQAMDGISSRFLKEMKPYLKLLVLQHSVRQLPGLQYENCYDLVISAFPPAVTWYRQQGIPAELNRMAFEPSILYKLQSQGEIYDVTFVGSLFSGFHTERVTFLETLCNQLNQIAIWSPNVDHLSSISPIRKVYMGQAWGRDMYEILHHSKITLNHHGDYLPYATNCRLYEATGVGTLLITDWKVNLHEIFEPGKEVVAYRTPEECAELIQYYLEHDEEREAIARAGQERTLREHTYYQRMQELVEIVRKYL